MILRNNFCFIVSAIALSLVGVAQAHARDEKTYICGDEASNLQLTFTYNAKEDVAQLTSVYGTFNLKKDEAGAWVPSIKFNANSDEPTLDLGSRHYACELDFKGMSAGSTDATSGLGHSLGGKVRSGPGMDYKQVGSLAEGKPIKIIQNSGVDFNGYDWFEINYGAGQTGYQWGGIMCSDELQMDGIYAAC